MSSFLYPLSCLFDWGVRTKNQLYDREFIKSEELNVPVIGVGNLTVGGTGKTSFVIWLLQELKKRELSGGVISRGYGRKGQGVVEVDASSDASICGDEPCLIAQQRLGPVFVAADRVAAGRAMLEKYELDFVIADDAFQHRRLKRDLDVVLLDFSAPKTQWKLLPTGRMREGFSALKRADVVVKTKRSLSDFKDFNFIESRIPKDKIVLEMDYKIARFIDGKGVSIKGSEGPFLLVSGVARPEGVEKLVAGRCKITDHIIFADHHSYTDKDAENIFQQLDFLKVEKFLTTQKDAVKLSRFSVLRDRIAILELNYEVKGQTDEFFKTFIR